MKIKNINRNAERLSELENSSFIAGMCVSGTAFFGYLLFKSIRYEEFIGKIIGEGIITALFLGGSIIEVYNAKNKREKLNKLLEKRK